jgi:endonuclease YncB( thermonuclease family)
MLAMTRRARTCGWVGVVVTAGLLPLAVDAQSQPPLLLAQGPSAALPAKLAAAAPNLQPSAAPTSGTISGAVTMATSAVTLVIGGRLIRLWGVDPGSANDVPTFNKWLQNSAGSVTCEPVAMTGRYKCMTADGHDVAEVALFSGFARVGQGAMNDYRSLEDQAREQHHGLWQQQ